MWWDFSGKFERSVGASDGYETRNYAHRVAGRDGGDGAERAQGPQLHLGATQRVADDQPSPGDRGVSSWTLAFLGPVGHGHAPDFEFEQPNHSFLRSVANTIEVGTSEIQRDVITTRALGLPRG